MQHGKFIRMQKIAFLFDPAVSRPTIALIPCIINYVINAADFGMNCRDIFTMKLQFVLREREREREKRERVVLHITQQDNVLRLTQLSFYIPKC